MQAQGFQEGISELRSKKGEPNNLPDAGRCTRLTCSKDAGIWFCIDTVVPATPYTYSDIADCAQRLKDSCSTGGELTVSIRWWRVYLKYEVLMLWYVG